MKKQTVFKRLTMVMLVTMGVHVAFSQDLAFGSFSKEKSLVRNNGPVVKKRSNSQTGTTYYISNQTNVLIQWINGDCGPNTAGDIYTDKPLVITVEKGGSRKISFIARYSAPKCGHCYSRVLTGDGSAEQYINLKQETFCY